MAKERSQFFDSVEDDRTYTADEFASFFRNLFTDGIKNGGTNLYVTPGTGLQVKVDYGSALIQGYAYFLEDDATGKKTIALNGAEGQARIDRIVLRLDKSGGERSIKLAAVKGTPSASPSAPVLTRDANIYELSLARVIVPAGAVSLSSASITDERYNPNVCGLINGLVELDASQFQEQADAILQQLAGQGYLPFDGTAQDSAKLGGELPGFYSPATHNHDGTYLKVGGTAQDAGKLGGQLPVYYSPATHNHDGTYAPVSHNHSAGNITSGTLNIDRIPTGTTGTTVALGNHNHSGTYAPASHSHSGGQVIISYGLSDPPTLPTGQIYVKI